MKVVLVGGNSRSARAFTQFAHAHRPDLEFLSIVRSATDTTSSSQALVVPDYTKLVREHLVGGDAVINFVGTTASKDREALKRVNVTTPAAVAAEARAAGVRHLIHLSSLSPYGRTPFIDARTPFAPVSPYGRTKAEAEAALSAHRDSTMVTTLLRIPVIYGRGTPSKLAQLAAILSRTPVFPTTRHHPRRSILSYENLSRVLVDLLDHPRDGPVFAADPEPFRLDEFAGLVSRTRLVRMPAAFLAPLRLLAPDTYHSLFEAMEIDPECLLRPSEFPLVPTEQALRAAFA